MEISKFTELWAKASKEVKSSTNTEKQEIIIGNVNQCVLDSIRADLREFACSDKNDSYSRRLDMLMFLEFNWYCTGSRNTTR